ncbi:hypothetical protein [Niallia taxi]|uniref:hypothetical protein n=1 Tax=Niallia taxi TaxID=2499688 RepID=UPI002E245C25|nr:hypothetical protein [Niallia taxi]
MSAILNIREGIRQQAKERERKLAEKQADKKNETEKDRADKKNSEEAMSVEQMQEHIILLSKAVLELTEKLNGGK